MGGGAAITSSPPAYLTSQLPGPLCQVLTYLMLRRFLMASPTLLFLAFNLLLLLLELGSSRRAGFWGLMCTPAGIYTEGRRSDAIVYSLVV